MQFTVLGNTRDYLRALSPGSSYLVESSGARVLLDAGPGAREALAARGGYRIDTADRASTVSRPVSGGTSSGSPQGASDASRAAGAEGADASLPAPRGPSTGATIIESQPTAGSHHEMRPWLDAIVVSHWHYDHVLDLLPIVKAADDGTPLIIPSGTAHHLDRLAEVFGYRGPFDAPGPVIEARAGAAVTVGDLELTFAPTAHSTPSMATRLRDAEGRTLVYASDTAPCPGLRELAAGADDLILHVLLPAVEAGNRHGRVHSTGETAAGLIAECAPGRVHVSHVYHGTDTDVLLAALRTGHDRPVEVLRPGECVRVAAHDPPDSFIQPRGDRSEHPDC